MPHIDPTFAASVQATLNKHESATHAFSGGAGLSCFVWVAGPASGRSKRPVRKCFSSNCLRLSDDLNGDLKAIPGYEWHFVNLD